MLLPIALALGAGAESRVSMGIAVVGGMLISTLLTLYVVPTMYCYFAKPKTTLALQDEYSEPRLAEKDPASVV
ncbi:MAG: efflux RND transporter permease subunit [Candidatus Thermochlorobacter sp.]